MSIFNALKIIVILSSILYRWSISLNTYSGQGKPVMFGDYEAQRHWMEITFNLNISDWYSNTSDNNLNYWGLDYPPLTAYHSYLLGHVADKIDPNFVKLHESRGIENERHKFFMRITVLLFDLIIFYPSVYLILNEIICSTKTKDSIIINTNQKDYLISLLLILLNPNLVLIDHGHFQYNSISLGLMQLAILFILYYTHDNNNNNSKRNLLHLVLSSLFFTMALNYKQMELYHALPIFFYLLGLCFKSNIFKNGFVKLVFIGSTVILTFLILWLPFILNGLDSVVQVVTRIFPIKRGLFEDKVANFWCSISPFIKLKENFSLDTLTKLSFLATLIFNLPCCLNLLLRPSRQRFMLALVNSALVFYLFSFQVHEKSIMIATVPACLLINFYPFIITWFILIANLSMLPLLIKDGLVMAYISTSLIFLLISTMYYKNRQTKESLNYWPNLKLFNNLIKFVYFLSLLGLLILTLCALFLKPPKKLPDLWTVLICIYSCGHFIIFSIVFNLIQFTLKSEDLFLGSTTTIGKLFNFDCSLFTYNNSTLSDAKKKLN